MSNSSEESAVARGTRVHALLEEALRLREQLEKDGSTLEEERPAFLGLSIRDVLVEGSTRRIGQIIKELAKELGHEAVLLDWLSQITTAPNRHNPDYPHDVRLDLSYEPRKGWRLTRDDAAGGGPWRRGPDAPTPVEAVQGFVVMDSMGKWST